MAKDPAQCTKDLLVAKSIGTFAAATGWGIYVGQLPAAPDTIVLCNLGPGRSPMPHLLLNEPAVQVMVRGAKNGYVAAYNKMKDVVTALLGMQTTVVQGDTYRSCVQVGDVIFLGQDDNTRPMFSANFRFIVLPAAESGDNRVPIT